jgi:aspartyl-tRNA(Asn)/glutamyl-tRNA(Gln) amidotransferase subunit A
MMTMPQATQSASGDSVISLTAQPIPSSVRTAASIASRVAALAALLCEAYAIHEANLRRRFTDYGEMFRDRMALAGLISGADYVQALRGRHELVDEFDRAMAGLDLILTASAPTEAPPIDSVGKFATFERPSLTMPFNVTGSPAMSMCCGYTDGGLPLSLQLIGRRFDDAKVLRLAHAYEQATQWRQRRPAL